MKNLLTLCAIALFAVASTAQDAAPLQEKGTWYLGTADATQVFKLFSDEGMTVDPFIGYAVADNIGVTLALSQNSDTAPGAEPDSEVTSSAFEVRLGGAYFFGDNYYGQAQIISGSADDGLGTDTSVNDYSGFGVGVGKWIDVKDWWYVSPQLNYTTYSQDPFSGSAVELRIQFGAKF
ncbi:MAG: hypothetical protein CMD33_06720 [Flavobacteriales bacterium]|nr:hypothetical protein [Flavobacteriales bacterium]